MDDFADVGTKRALSPADVAHFHYCSEPRISPDGRFAVYCRSTSEADLSAKTSALFVVSLKEPHVVRQLTRGSSDTNPCWAPDSKSVGFLRKRKLAPVNQIFVVPIDGGEPYALSAFSIAVAHLDWTVDHMTCARACARRACVRVRAC